MDQLASYPPSAVRAATTTRDGKWTFVAEGASLVFIESLDGNGDPILANFTAPDGSKRVPIGEKGVAPAKMILDPDAQLVPGPLVASGANLLYIAAGRDGLWMMEADTDLGATNRAWRIDDSGNLDPAVQGSNRWCCDVETMHVGGQDYLLALFGRKNGPGDIGSRLRIYRLSDVRSVANHVGETGGEIAPLVQVKLSGHPAKPPAPANPSYGRGVAISMAVDEYHDGAEDVADVYVAMGHHGLVRVPIAANGTAGAPQWGPIFGTGSWYAGPTPPVHPPAGKDVLLYGNLVHEYEATYGANLVRREEFPFFADVAVYNGPAVGGQHVHQLFAAVDHLLWVAFDLDAHAWNEQMPILHHEGQEVVSASGTYTYRGVASRVDHELAGKTTPCPRIEIVQHPFLGPHLVASTSALFVHSLFDVRFEGPTYHPDFSWGGGPATLPIDADEEVLAYPIVPAYSPGTYHHLNQIFDQLGGHILEIPPDQPDPDRILMVVGDHSSPTLEFPTEKLFIDQLGLKSKLGISQAFLRVGPVDTSWVERKAGHGHGRKAFALATSILNPNLLLVGGNDGGLPSDGWLYTEQNPTTLEWSFATHYDPPATPPYDDRQAISAILLDGDGDAQWHDPAQPADRTYVLGGGIAEVGDPDNATLGDSAERWILSEITVPSDLTTAEPNWDHHWFGVPPKNRYGKFGRIYYMVWTMSRGFDAWLDGLGHPERHLFGVWQKTPEGLAAIDRAEFLARAQLLGDGEDVFVDQAGAGVEHRRLVTHPEFNPMPFQQAVAKQWWGANSEGGEVQHVRNWCPEVVQVKDPATGEFGPWVLAVPCNSVSANPDWGVYQPAGQSDWIASTGTWRDLFTHGMVQFFEMAPETSGGRYWPKSVAVFDSDGDEVDGNSPLSKIIPDAPEDADGNIWRIQAVRMTVNGNEKVYLFSCDMGGRLYVHEIQDILSYTNPDASVHSTLRVARWETPPSLFDDLPNGAFDVEIDYRGLNAATVYVAVRRVGVVVLRFDPTLVQEEDRLLEVRTIQTADHPSALHLRENADGSRHLLLSDYASGIRLYGKEGE